MSFAEELMQAAAGIDADILGTRARATEKLFGAVVADTPVLTGALRSDWQATEGDVPWSEMPAIRPINDNFAEIHAVAAAAKGDAPLFLTNNKPYCEIIEDGSSAKAPEGMMRKNATRWDALVDEAAEGMT